MNCFLCLTTARLLHFVRRVHVLSYPIRPFLVKKIQRKAVFLNRELIDFSVLDLEHINEEIKGGEIKAP